MIQNTNPAEPGLHLPPDALGGLPQSRYELILFDLDGTLIETAPDICDAVNDTLRQNGLAPVTLAQVERWIGHGTRELLIQALAFVGNTAAPQLRQADQLAPLFTQFDLHYLKRCGSASQLYPQVREVLTALRAGGVRLAVVTNKEAQFTLRLLKAHQLLGLFDQVVSGDTLPSKKPDPAGILACLEVLGVDRQRALFVGDSAIDVATARNAQVAVWALPYGYNGGQPIEACAPDRVIADMSALLGHGQWLD